MSFRIEMPWPFPGETKTEGYLEAEVFENNACRLILGSRREVAPREWVQREDPASLPRLFRSVPAGVKEALRFTTSRGGAVHFGPGPDADLLIPFIRELKDRIAPHGVAWPAEALEAMTDGDWRDLLLEAGGSAVGLDEAPPPAPDAKPWRGPRA